MNTEKKFSNEQGSAIVIALFVLALLSVFAAYALTRTSAEAASVGNETAEARALYAAQGSLEKMTRDFNKVFERRLNPTAGERAVVENGNTVPGLSQALGGDYVFEQQLLPVTERIATVLGGGPYAGLTAIRDTWRLRTTATDQRGGTQVQLTRNILNNRIPIFQFGIFYDDDLELFNGPNFRFGGRVHSNRHFFLHPSANGAWFDSRVTAHGYIVTETKKNGDQPNIASAVIRVRDAENNFQPLGPNEGSVLNGAPNVFAQAPFVDPGLPTSRINANWDNIRPRFDGNIVSRAPELKLPMKVGANTDLIELIHRGKNIGDLFSNGGVVAPVTAASTDTPIETSERFANKTGIRVSLADSKSRLPGCASGVGITAVAGPCGLRLDGHLDGSGQDPVLPATDLADPTRTFRSRGYAPLLMTDGYRATRLNGERFNTGNPRQVWIKVETVRTDATTGAIVTQDITADFLSLGVTEQAQNLPGFAMDIAGYNSAAPNNDPAGPISQTNPQLPPMGTDSRSIIKLQRFVIRGDEIPRTGALVSDAFLTFTPGVNAAVRYTGVDNLAEIIGPTGACVAGCAVRNADPSLTLNREQFGHLKRATVGGIAGGVAVVPFPIQMFDVREGFHYDQRGNVAFFTDSTRLTRNGVMSMIDIDVANLRRFLRGDFDGLFPVNANLRNMIPQDSGWVVYVSDRRGDDNFDGELDMEDVYGAGLGNDGATQPGEDLDQPGWPGFGVLDGGAFPTETARYNTDTLIPDRAAATDHRHFRRGVRLINGTVLPGIYDAVNTDNTRGFTVASENGVYVWGNYNARNANPPPVNANTPFSEYFPRDTATHIPASVVGDAVTILSNNWNDGASFRTAAVAPWGLGGRVATETTMRFAMIAGDTITSRRADPHQGGSQNAGVFTDARGNGGVHNFKRFLENWGGIRLNYSGSLINLYNSRNNNGSYKCCINVYGAPNRNWVFDSTFLDPARIPPGTPFFQYVQTTGFERSTD